MKWDIEQEWESLKSHFEFIDDEKDGRRCFFCGVLAAISEALSGESVDLQDVERQIREKLKRTEDEFV